MVYVVLCHVMLYYNRQASSKPQGQDQDAMMDFLSELADEPAEAPILTVPQGGIRVI